jgi:alkylated DNA repair dioxygenase AlkB
VVHYGYRYAYESFRIEPGPQVPEWLEPLRGRAAAAAGLTAAGELAEALVTEYPPGATIGWHRDAPAFGIVVALSLGAACRFRFRRGEADARETAEVEVEPRSLYILDGPARTEWQHQIPPTKALRYSITFRTLRRKRS